MDSEKILARIVQIGTVIAVNNDERIARVKFRDTGITSDWLRVLKNQPYIPSYDEMPQRTEYEEGGAGEKAFENHKHDLIILPWMPKVNDVVLVIYLPVFNSDGYVVGGI